MSIWHPVMPVVQSAQCHAFARLLHYKARMRHLELHGISAYTYLFGVCFGEGKFDFPLRIALTLVLVYRHVIISLPPNYALVLLMSGMLKTVPLAFSIQLVSCLV